MTAVTRIASALVVCAILPVSGALAFEPTGSVVGDHLLKILEASGANGIAYASVSDSGGRVTIRNITGTVIDRAMNSRRKSPLSI